MVKRLGFTLVELLVVIAILSVLVGLLIMIIPGITDGQYNTRAATQLQQWIEIAKQGAAKSQRPRGVRLVYNPANATQVLQLQFVEQPPPFNLHCTDPNTGLLVLSTASVGVTTSNQTVSFSSAPPNGFAGIVPTLTGGLAQSNTWQVQPNDFIELGGVMYRIASVDGPTQLTLATPVPSPLAVTNYRIIRQPRPIMGEDPLEMAIGVVIDVTPLGISGGKYDLPAMTATANLDILFAPDGRLLPTPVNNLAAYDKIILWVRDTNVGNGILANGQRDPKQPWGQGDPTLIVVHTRTGLIAAHPVDQNLTNPYTFTSSAQRD